MYKARLKNVQSVQAVQNNPFFAIKQFKQFRTEEGVSPSAIREIKLLRELNHPNIIKLLKVTSKGLG